jgi:hypothetical protein
MAEERSVELDHALGQLSDPQERFLARVLESVLARGWRTAEDFLTHFSAEGLMHALEDAPLLRVRILAEGIGIPKKIAERCSTATAAEDLEIALEESVTDADTVLALFPLAERVQRLPAGELWRFCAADSWLEEAKSAAHRQTRAAERVSVVLEAALAEELVSLSEIASGTRLDELAQRLPDADLRRAFTLAVESALGNLPVDQSAIADLLDVPALVAGVDPADLWNDVVIERVVRPAGFLTVGMPSMVRERSNGFSQSSARLRIAPPTRPPDDVTKKGPSPHDVTKRVPSVPPPPDNVMKRIPTVPPPPDNVMKRPAAPPPENLTRTLRVAPPIDDVTIEVGDDEVEDATDPNFQLVVQKGALRGAGQAGSTQNTDPDRARRVALTDALRDIGRLPKNHEYLSLPILRGVAKMYRDMKSQRSKGGRAQVIREAFDNDAHLRVGLLAIVELIDPNLDVAQVREASTDTLIDILLAQERALWQKAKASGSEPLRGRLPPPPTSRR